MRASEKHPLEWLPHHGWTKHRHMTWRRPKRGTVIHPLTGWTKGDRRRAAHELRESWKKLTNQTSRPQTVELQNEPLNGERLKLVPQKVAVATGPARWLMLGAATSPLEYQLRSNGRVKCLNQDVSNAHAVMPHVRRCQLRLCSGALGGRRLKRMKRWRRDGGGHMGMTAKLRTPAANFKPTSLTVT